MTDSGPSTGRGRGRIAYLGPEGTYGQQATRAFIDRYLRLDLESIACPTISDAYEEDAEYTVLPLENTIYGPVTETLDCFFGRFNNTSSTEGRESGILNGVSRKGKGKEKEIIATLNLPIRHCLVVKKGTKLEDIWVVSSHEQALGQSSTFLNTHLPRAKRVAVASTALAAESLLSPVSLGEQAAGEGERAAICSKSVVEIYDQLEVLYEGTQDRSDNFTRFILLHSPRSHTTSTDITTSKSKSKSNFYLLNSPNVISTLLSQSTSIGSLHTRPTSCNDGRVYPHGVFIELRRRDGQHDEREDQEGVLFLGSGPLVQLDNA